MEFEGGVIWPASADVAGAGIALETVAADGISSTARPPSDACTLELIGCSLTTLASVDWMLSFRSGAPASADAATVSSFAGFSSTFGAVAATKAGCLTGPSTATLVRTLNRS